jgi:capsid protein
MLEAWRVVEFHRKRLGQGDCRKKYRMLVEEAYLRDLIDAPDFYENIDLYTAVDWIGTPKRDIEPFKMIQADLQMFNARVKPLEQIIIENGGSGFMEIASQIEEEMAILKEKGLLTGVQDSAMEQAEEEPEQDNQDDNQAEPKKG